MKKKKVAVLISGFGGNLQALINACSASEYPAQIVTVISNKADAYGLQRAADNNIPAHFIDHKTFSSREEFDAALHEKVTASGAEIVCLAGFMRLLSSGFVDKWRGRIINIHPSLLPEFKGANAVKDALAAGATRTGCTVHHVIPEVDAGEIIVQRAIDILPGDTEETVHARIHEQEHIAYPQALKLLCERLL